MITEKSPIEIEDIPKVATRRSPLWKRRLASVSRWLHIYLSMASFAIVFFFAITGITLNHTDWFAHQQRTSQFKGVMDRSWLKPAPGGDVAKLEVVEKLRASHHLSGALTDFRVDETQCVVSFKGPGYSADAFIDRETGSYELTENRMGLVAVINDLHKGRDTGRSWAWVIDVSAGLMTFVSLTGLVLIFFLQRKLATGLLAAAAGGLFCYLIYAIWVP